MALGLLHGIAGAALLAVAWEPAPSFGIRLLSLGLVLPLVLGLGTLLVPAFAGIPRALEIPGLSSAHERRGRRPFYLTVAAALVAATVAEAMGRAALAALLRALAATPVLVLGWKLFARGSRATTHAASLRVAGASTLLGLWTAALMPGRALAGLHLVFLGGFGLLTLAIGTRVVVSHGKFALDQEARVLGPGLVGLVLVSALVRVVAEATPGMRTVLLAASGLVWSAAWLVWGLRVLPLIVSPRAEALVTPGSPAQA